MNIHSRTAAGCHWLAASTLLILSIVAAPAMAQSCAGFANSLAVDPASQIAQEFDAANNYGPVTVTLTIKNATSLPSGASLAWTQTGGPGVTLNTSNPLRPTFVVPSVGATGATLGFRVQAFCNSVSTGSPALASVTIQNVDRPPVVTALASPPIAGAGEVVTLSATGSDPDGDPIAYSWTQIAGAPSVTLSDPGAASTTFVAPTVPAEVTLEFRVEARAGTLARSANVTVTVTAANLPPFAALSCLLEVDEGELFRLDGTGSYDPEGAPLTYEWFINEMEVGLAFSLDGESGDYVDRVAPSLGLGMSGGVEVRLRVSESPTVFTDATCPFMIVDVTAPVIDGADDRTVDATSPAGADVDYGLTATDNVEGDVTPDLVCVPPSGSAFALNVSTDVGCEVSDFNNNLATAEFVVTVSDLTSPVIDAHVDVAVEAEGPLTSVDYDLPGTFDVVDVDLLATCDPPSGTPFAVGSHTITCDAVDTAGNEAESTAFTLTVHDLTPPDITVPAPITAEATSPLGAEVSFDVSAFDLADEEVDATCSPQSGDVFPLGTTTVDCSAHDSAIRAGFPDGNVATASFTVTVVDTTPPTLSLPADIGGVEATSPAGATVWFSATATDLVDGIVEVSCTPATGSTFPLHATTVSCSATDAASNSAAGSFGITVVDTTPPTIDPHDPIGGIEATGPGGAYVEYVAPATHDLVDGDGVATCSPGSGTLFALGTTIVECNAQDTTGNEAASTSFDITVVDATPPTIAAHDPIGPIEATGPAGASVAYASPATSDIVDGNGIASCEPTSGSTFALGINTVECSAADAAGNAATPTTFTISVVDTAAPVIAAHGNVGPIEATGPTGAIVGYTSPSTSDAVDGPGTASCTPTSGSTFALGTTTVTCNAVDVAGNVAVATTFTVTVQDTTAPRITPHAGVTATASSNSSAVVYYTLPTASDLVDGTVTVSCTPASGSTFNVGSTTVTCSATDAAGNTATSTFEVIVSYSFNGFFRPIDNLPTVNVVKAGSAIPVKFSLGGNQGLNIFAANHPASVSTVCTASQTDALEETVTAGSSSLQYDPGADQYIYVWKTDKNWTGCRQLQVKLRDGTSHWAMFSFTR